MKKKKPSRRDREQYPNLKPEFNLKTRSDLLDQDYLHKLNEKELKWLDQFNKEYVNDHVNRQSPKKNLHKSKRLIKDCDDRNNSRNRDILTRAKASNNLTDYEELYEESVSNHYEDQIIEELDKKSIKESIEWLADELNRDEEKLETNLINEQSNKVKS